MAWRPSNRTANLFRVRYAHGSTYYPILSELSDEASGKYKVVKVDVEKERQLANQYSVSALPTILLFKNGDVRAKLVGLKTKKRILEVIESHT